MQTVSGKLIVRRNTDRNSSAYKEALLKCSLGKFYVKTSQLEDLQMGEYDGFFTLTKIDRYYQHQQGKLLFGVEATIEKMAFISQPEALPSHEVFETKTPRQFSLLNEESSESDENDGDEDEDEEDEENIEADIDNTSPSAPIRTHTRFINNESEDDDEQLFGSLYPLGEEVTLDASEDRHVLNQQIHRLKEIGYQFNHKAQKWALRFFE